MKGTGIKRSDDLEKWLEFRRKHVTASDAAAIMGKSPFNTPLGVWMEKTGRRQSKDQENRDALNWGLRGERMAVDWVAEEIGKTVVGTDEIFVHPDIEWLSCTPDGFYGPGHEGPIEGYVEVKCPSPWTKDHWTLGMPKHYEIQTEVGCEVTGLEEGVLAAMIQPRLYWGRITASDDRVMHILDACHEFWHENVLKDRPPALTGSSKETGFLKELHPEDTGEVVTLEEDAVTASKRLLDLKEEHLKPLQREIRELENTIKMNIGSASYGVLPDGGAWSWLHDSRNARRFNFVKSVPKLKATNA